MAKIVSLSLRAYSEQWERDVLPLKKPATVVTFRSHLRMICESLGHLPLAQVDNRRVQAFVASQAAVKSSTTVKNLWMTLRLVLQHAQRDGVIASIPQPVLPKRGRAAQEWLSAGEMSRLIAAADGAEKVFYALLSETGVRIGEALALTPADVDIERRIIDVRRSVYAGRRQDPKTLNSFRSISLSAGLTDMLSDLVQNTDERLPLFRTARGTPWWPAAALRKMQEMLKQIGIAPVGFHAFRRGNVTLCATDLGMPEAILAQRVGHAAKGMTLGVYCQRVVGADREWADKIAQAIGLG